MAALGIQQLFLCLFLVGLFCLSAVGLQHRQGHGVYGPRRVGGPGRSANRGLPPAKPYFKHEPYNPQTGEGGRNITTVEGGRVTLTCTVRNLGENNTVSWIRKGRVPVVLTYGDSLFTSDPRVSLVQPKGKPDTWQLVLDPVLDKDNGLYECQVNMMDKMSLVFKLNIMPAKARLLGESAVYVKAGSTISLTCEINLFSVPPPDIDWYHGNRILNFDSPRGGISLETEKSRTGTISKLLVTRANTRDSGNYTCRPSRGEPVSADVHIITDENPAGLQDGQTSGQPRLGGSVRISASTFLLSLLLPLLVPALGTQHLTEAVRL